jgi:hypothetical protein
MSEEVTVESQLQILRSDAAIDLKTRALTMLANMGTEEQKREHIVQQNGLDIIVDFVKKKEFPKTQMRACVCLLNICANNEIKQRIHETGVIEVLIDLVHEYGKNSQTAQYAVGALTNLAVEPVNQQYIAGCGGLEAIVTLLKICKADDMVTKNYAIGVLGSLSIIPEIGHEFLEKYDGLGMILEFLNTYADDIEIMQRSTGVLWNIAISVENRKLFHDRPELVDRLLLLLKLEDREIILNSLVVLGMLSMEADLGSTINSTDGSALESAISLLRGTGEDEELKGYCLMLIGNLCQCDPKLGDHVREMNALPFIVEHLASNELETLGKAAGAVLSLAVNHQNAELFAKGQEENALEHLISILLIEYAPEERDALDLLCAATTALGIIAYHDSTKEAIVEKGGVEALIEFLVKNVRPDGEIEFGDVELLAKITGAILNLSSDQQVRDIFKQQNGLQPLIDLLDHEEEEVRNNAAGALCNMSMDPSIKSQIKKLGGLRRLLTIMQENLSQSPTVTRVITKEKAKKSPKTSKPKQEQQTPQTPPQTPPQEEEKQPSRVGPPKKKVIKMVDDDTVITENVSPVVPVQRKEEQDRIEEIKESTDLPDVDQISDDEVMQQFEKVQQRSVGSWIQSKMQSVVENAGRSKASFGRVVEPLSADEFNLNPNEAVPVEALKRGRQYPSWVDPEVREKYLADQDFNKLFGVSREEFDSFPEWKKTQLKQNVGLF